MDGLTNCNSRYGCELWSLYDNSINEFDVAWRKAERRVLNIPYDTHSNLIPLLVSNTLPFFDEICKRSARFILSCIQSESSFVRSTVRCGIFVGCCNSFIGRNVVLLCSRFKWQFNDFVCGNVSLNNCEFLHNFYSRVVNDDWSAAQLLEEILRIRDGDFRVLFSDGGRLSTSELNCILSYVASSRS